jgi:hypothetical protein
MLIHAQGSIFYSFVSQYLYVNPKTYQQIATERLLVWQWALNFAVRDEHTLIFVCKFFSTPFYLLQQADSGLSFIPGDNTTGQSKLTFLSMRQSNKCDPPQLLAFATEELSLRVGQTLAGLLNATLVRICSEFFVLHDC